MGIHDGGTPMGMTEDLGDTQAEAGRWNSKGNAYLAVRDYITAISCFDLALKTHPGSEQEDRYLSNRATAEFRLGNYEAAAEGFRQAGQLQPTNHNHFTCLGKVYLRWGGHEHQALEALEKSLRLEYTAVAAHLATKAFVALEKRQQTPHGRESPHPGSPHTRPPLPHPPHRSLEHLLTKDAPTVKDFSKPTGPLVKMSPARIRGFLRSDSVCGGVAMLSSDEVRGHGGGQGTNSIGGGKARDDTSIGASNREATDAGGEDGNSRSNRDALRTIIQNRARVEEDDDNADEDGDDGGNTEPPKPRTAAGMSRQPRRRCSGDSISTLLAAETGEIVDSATRARPPASAPIVGGFVARAVARVEEGPMTVKSIPDQKVPKQVAEDAASIRPLVAMLNAIASGEATVAAASADTKSEDRESAGGGGQEGPSWRPGGVIVNPRGFDRSSGSIASGTGKASAADKREPRSVPSALPSPSGSDFGALSITFQAQWEPGVAPAKNGEPGDLSTTVSTTVAAASGVGALDARATVGVGSAGNFDRTETKPAHSPPRTPVSRLSAFSSLVSGEVKAAREGDVKPDEDGPKDAGLGASTGAAPEEVDEAARRKRSEDPAGAVAAVEELKPSAAALAAIAAGAAPVKWGREGAAERSANNVGSVSGSTSIGTSPLTKRPLSSSSTGSCNGGRKSQVYRDSSSGCNNSEKKPDNSSNTVDIGDCRSDDAGAKGGDCRWPIRTAGASNGGGASDGSHDNIIHAPPPDEAANRSTPPGVGAQVEEHAGNGTELALYHRRRASEGSAWYSERHGIKGGQNLSHGEGCGGVDQGRCRRPSSLTRDRRHKRQTRSMDLRSEVFLDNEEGEWGQTPTGRSWRLRWPGRSRHVPIGICRASPNVVRSFFGSRDTEEETAQFAGGTHDGESVAGDSVPGVGSHRSIDPQMFSSTESEVSVTFARTHRRWNSDKPRPTLEQEDSSAATPRIRPAGQPFATPAEGVGRHHRSQSVASSLWSTSSRCGHGTVAGGGGRRRGLFRWMHGRKGSADGIPSEELVEKWMRVVLGPRALGLLKADECEDGVGGVSHGFMEKLKDGRLLVRLAHAVGGVRTVSLAEDVEATTPMLQLLNIHTFLAAARAIGVPSTSLFHPKDLLSSVPGGSCSPAILKCLAELSEAVRRNSTTDPPGDVFHGPFLGDEDGSFRANPVKIEEDAFAREAIAGAGGGDEGVFLGFARKGSSSAGAADSNEKRRDVPCKLDSGEVTMSPGSSLLLSDLKYPAWNNEAVLSFPE